MNKSELSKLLQKINSQYWGKLSDQINNKDFLEIWYESLKEYDSSLIDYLYDKYNDTQFPPTAKYFTVFADQMIETIEEEIRVATNEIWIYSKDDYQTTRNALKEYLDKVAWKEKNEILCRAKRDFIIATREEKISIKDWLNER